MHAYMYMYVQVYYIINIVCYTGAGSAYLRLVALVSVSVLFLVRASLGI